MRQHDSLSGSLRAAEYGEKAIQFDVMGKLDLAIKNLTTAIELLEAHPKYSIISSWEFCELNAGLALSLVREKMIVKRAKVRTRR